MENSKQISLEEVETEILRELNFPEAEGYAPPPDPQLFKNEQTAPGQTQAATRRERVENPARKPFRIKDFDSPRDKEMAVFTHAKKLSEYIFIITEKSPKKFRWSIVSRLQSSSVEIVENLYRANFERDDEKRIYYQKSAAVGLKLLDFYTETARKKQAITVHQMEVIAKQILQTTKLLNGWVKSTKRQ